METLKFGGKSFEPIVRMLSDMRNVLYDKNWTKTAKNFDVYWFFRNLYRSEKHKKIMTENDLRYDVTIIPPNKLGIEFTKTVGHYHPKKPGTSVTYPEIYEVLKGKAHYLLQKENNGILVDVVMIKASRGDRVIIPPGYGHITINASKRTLKMANWVCNSFSSEYGSIEKMGGGAYFMLIDGIIPNKNYGNVPQLRFAMPQNFEKDMRFYDLIKKPKVLRFLTHPEKSSELRFIVN